MAETQEWAPSSQPEIGETLRWKEPLWAAPNKPRGKPDKIGEQEIIAQVTGVEDVLEFTVISVKKLDKGAAPLKVKEADIIRRKKTSLDKGDCHKLLG